MASASVTAAVPGSRGAKKGTRTLSVSLESKEAAEMEAVERSKHSPNTAQHLSRVGSPIRGAKQMNNGRHGGTPHSMPVPTTRQELEAAIAAIKGNTNLSRVRRQFHGGAHLSWPQYSLTHSAMLCMSATSPPAACPAPRNANAEKAVAVAEIHQRV